MARPRSIDRDRVLDAAEAVVSRSGAGALSFGAIAEEAGLTKASVQSAFGTRAALIDMLIDRWMSQEEERHRAALGEAVSAGARLVAHLRTTLADMLDDNGQRVSTLLAVLAGEGEHSASMRAWYLGRLGDLAAATDEERRRRVLYLAAEGAFFLRCLVGLPVSEVIWRDVFADLERMSER
jgi:AcrR family transcriptional regulator